jgi:hypothetical protein
VLFAKGIPSGVAREYFGKTQKYFEIYENKIHNFNIRF